MRMSSSNSSALLALLLSMLAVIVVVALIVVALEIVAYWKLFVKAGEPGWKAVIPAYGPYTMFKLVWKPLYFWIMVGAGVLSGLFASLMVTTRRPAAFIFLHAVFVIAMLVFYIIMLVKMAYAYGEGAGFAVGMVFLTVIFLLILAFGKSKYVGAHVKEQDVAVKDEQ